MTRFITPFGDSRGNVRNKLPAARSDSRIFGYNGFSLALNFQEGMRLGRWWIPGVAVALLASAGFSRDVVQAALKIDPASLTFPRQSVGAQGAALTVTLSNSGSADLDIADILVSGIDFAESNTCGKRLSAGASCSLVVTFKPATTGPRLGTISVFTSDPKSPQLIPLTGAGK
jgi:hypothetical protein